MAVATSREGTAGALVGERPFGGAAGLTRLGHATSGLLVVLGVAVVLFANLGGYPLWEPDEARHSLIARELHRATDWRGWLLPHLEGRPYRDKPILFYWLAATAYAVVGEREVAARAVSALAALGVVAVVWAWAHAAWGRRPAVLAAGVVITTGEFLALGRYASLDMLLTLWVTLGVLAVYRWAEDPAGRATLRPVAVAAALGALTKGLVAPVLIAAIGVAYVRTAPVPSARRPIRGATLAAIALAIAAPWYLAAGILDPAYLREFFLEHHLARFLFPSGRLHPEPWWFTPAAAAVGFLPWAVLLPAVIAWLRTERPWDPGVRLCVCWVSVVVIFFTVSSGKLGTYVLPAMPALGLLVGRWLADLEPWRRDARLARACLVGAAAVTSLAGLALLGLAGHVAEPWRPLARPVGLVLLLLAGTAAVLVRERRTLSAMAVLAVGSLATATVVYGPAASRLAAITSDATLARIVHTSDPGHAAPLIALGIRPHSLSYYADRRIRAVNQPGRLRHVLARRPLVFVVTSGPQAPRLLREGTFVRWSSGANDLYATQAPPAAPGADGASPPPPPRW